MNNKCPQTLINILDCWYDRSFACIKWGDTLSAVFKINSGTRQGRVCSPALFSVFINEVLMKVQQSFLICYIRNICFNACMFADDLILLSISISDLEKMIKVRKLELDWLDMKINVNKSVCIRIGDRFNVDACPVAIDGVPISWSPEMRYLGHNMLFLLAYLNVMSIRLK